MQDAILSAVNLSEKEKALKVLDAVYLTRFMDEKMSKLVKQNKGGTFHLPVAGHELIGTMCGLFLTPGKDWGLPYYRDRAFAIGLGCPLDEILGAHLARELPHHSGGRMMPDHFSHKKLRIPCQSSCVGSQFLQAVGVAKGIQISGKDEVVYVSAGDGATSQGDFHEALNFSCIHKLPVLFVIQDNGWAISVPISEQTAGGSIAPLARGYEGLQVFEIDGCSYEEVDQALEAAIARGRAKEGPTLIVAKVPRIGAHSSSDDPQKYKDKAMMDEERSRDPLLQLEAYLLRKEMITDDQISTMRQRAFEAVERACDKAENYPYPEASSCALNVFKAVEQIPFTNEEPISSSHDAIVMVDAINHALDEEMQKDPSLIVFGQDVAHGKGGVFGVTRNLTAKYGVERCFNTTLAESTIIGMAIGLSVTGVKPVAEVQFADYHWTGVNQLFNELASFHYRSNAEWNCPVVIRMPYGGYIQGGPYHSQSIEAYLCHTPGLKVVIPSNAADAKRLMKAAIRDPNPVVFLEHKALYRQRVFCARSEPSEEEILPLGKANIVRKGDDVTIIAYGMMVVMAVEVADKLQKEGIAVEVIDLRTLVPLDMDTVITSVKKTSKVLIAHEAARNCGFGAELAAQIGEKCFAYLDAPIVRVASEDCPVPYSKILEEEVLPQPRDLEKAIRSLASF